MSAGVCKNVFLILNQYPQVCVSEEQRWAYFPFYSVRCLKSRGTLSHKGRVHKPNLDMCDLWPLRESAWEGHFHFCHGGIRCRKVHWHFRIAFVAFTTTSFPGIFHVLQSDNENHTLADYRIHEWGRRGYRLWNVWRILSWKIQKNDILMDNFKMCSQEECGSSLFMI